MRSYLTCVSMAKLEICAFDLKSMKIITNLLNNLGCMIFETSFDSLVQYLLDLLILYLFALIFFPTILKGTITIQQTLANGDRSFTYCLQLNKLAKFA